MTKISSFLLFIVLGLLSFSTARADFNDNVCNMMGWGGSCGTMGGGGFLAMGFLGLIYVAIVTFIVALIFWLVYRWIIKK